MSMITKAEAQAAAAAYQNKVQDRVVAYLTNLANSGVVGGTFSYSAVEDVTQLQAARTALIAAGWTVVVDQVAKTVTIS